MSNQNNVNAINEVLRHNSVTVSVKYVDMLTDSQKWQHDLFMVVFKKHDVAFTIEYKQGLGLRNKNKVVLPSVDNIMQCLLSDFTHGQSFNEWASDYGYDADSIKALNIYNACLDEETKLKSILSPEALKQLEIILEGA